MDSLTKLSAKVRKMLDARMKLLRRINKATGDRYGTSVEDCMQGVMQARTIYRELEGEIIATDRGIKRLLMQAKIKD